MVLAGGDGEKLTYIVVACVDGEGFSVRILCRVEILLENVLMSHEGVCIRRPRIDLNSPFEELQRRIRIPLQGETVPRRAPRRRTEPIHLNRSSRQVRQLHLLLLMPQNRRIVLHQAVHPRRIHIPRLFKLQFCSMVVPKLHIPTPQTSQYISSL